MKFGLLSTAAAATLFLLMPDAGCSGSSPNWVAETWAEVQQCHDEVGFMPGDTISLSGSVTANSQFAATKAFILKGASDCTLATVNGIENIPTSCPVVVTTTYTGGYLVNAILPAWSDADTPTVVIHDLEFQGTPSSPYTILRVEGCGDFDDRSVNIYNIYSNNVTQIFLANESTIGVVHNNNIQGPASGQPAFIAQNFGHTWGACTTNNWGDNAWAAADNFGTSKFLYYEDNVFYNNYAGVLTGLDAHNGARYAVRYNYFYNNRPEAHGRESARARSTRAIEGYSNTFAPAGIGVIGYFRGGTGVYYDNTLVSGTAVINLLANATYQQANAPFGGADGVNPWSSNSGSNPFDTLTASSTGTLTITDSSKSWTNHQWANYIIRKTSGVAVSSMSQSSYTVTVNTSTSHGFSAGQYVSCWGATGTAAYAYNTMYPVLDTPSATQFRYVANDPRTNTPGGTIKCSLGSNFAWIADNTSTQITFLTSFFGALQEMTIATGDTFQINLVSVDMDQPGMGQGSDLKGVDVPTASTLAGEATSAWYEWDNTGVDFSTGFSGACFGGCLYRTIEPGVHYINDTEKPGYTPYVYPHPFVDPSDTLVFTTQPVKTHTGSTMTTFVVTVQLDGMTDTSFANDITVSISSCGASLSGTVTVTPVMGVATFNNVTATGNGVNCTLTASATDAASGASSVFNVGPNQLGITVQPSASYTSGTTFNITVAGQYSDGTTDTSANNSVTISLNAVTGSGALSGSVTQSLSSGVRAFSLTISGAGTFTVTASASGLTSATSNGFSVSGDSLAFTTQPPASVSSGQSISVAVTVRYPNATTDASVTNAVTLSIGSGSCIISAPIVNPVSGTAAFTSVVVVSGSGSCVLTASALNVTSGNSDAFTVSGTPPPVGTSGRPRWRIRAR